MHTMRSSTLTLLTSLAVVLQASTAAPAVGQSTTVDADLILKDGGVLLPDGPDGLFTITFDPHNSTKAIITTLELFEGSSQASKRSKSSSVNSRQVNLPIDTWGCQGTHHNPGDYDRATRNFGAGCDAGQKI